LTSYTIWDGTQERKSKVGNSDAVRAVTPEAEQQLVLIPAHRPLIIRPQDPHLDGTGLRFETTEHGGEYPDTMPQAIKLMLIDAEDRSCTTRQSRRMGRSSTAMDTCSIPRMNNRQSLQRVPDVSVNFEIEENPEPSPRGGAQ
jgi:hypothetical protein